jgi:hypothetical protein
MSTRVHVHTSFQPRYSYERVAPMGAHFDPLFTPQLTPQEMLEAGVFDGWYFRGEHDEYPKEWFVHAKLAHDGPDSALNFFKVHASQPLSVWHAKGWIYPDDPHGWFEWYCRYYTGRRIPEEDARQIKRWYAIRRHIAQIVHNCTPGDLMCRRKQRQALLHWAYDSRV